MPLPVATALRVLLCAHQQNVSVWFERICENEVYIVSYHCYRLLVISYQTKHHCNPHHCLKDDLQSTIHGKHMLYVRSIRMRRSGISYQHGWLMQLQWAHAKHAHASSDLCFVSLRSHVVSQASGRKTGKNFDTTSSWKACCWWQKAPWDIKARPLLFLHSQTLKYPLSLLTVFLHFTLVTILRDLTLWKFKLTIDCSKTHVSWLYGDFPNWITTNALPFPLSLFLARLIFSLTTTSYLV